MNIKLILLLFIFASFNLKAQTDDYITNTLHNLNDTLNISVFFTLDLPPPYYENRFYLDSVLSSFKYFTNGKIKYSFIDPMINSETEKTVQDLGVSRILVQTIKDGVAYSQAAYMGLVIYYGNNTEALNIVRKENLDFNIARSINRIISDRKNIGIISAKSTNINTEFSSLNSALSKYFNVRLIDSSDGYNLDNLNALLIFSAAGNKLHENLKHNIDKYIMQGGRVIFFLDKVKITKTKEKSEATINNTDLDSILMKYSLKVENSIVCDKECAFISIPEDQNGKTIYKQVPFNYYPKIININKEILFFGDIQQVFLGFSSPINNTIAEQNGLLVKNILLSSDKAGMQNPPSEIKVSKTGLGYESFNKSNLVITASYEGRFRSIYDNTEGLNTKIILSGSGTFAKDEFRGPEENIDFIISLIEYLME